VRDIEHRALQKKLSPLVYHREVGNNVALYWEAIEAQLAVDVFDSLLSAGNPMALDGLFAIVDRRAAEQCDPQRHDSRGTSRHSLVPSTSSG